ncbi:MAG: cysteine desulfurase family protein [Anaerolineales bacterium]
MMKKNQIYLDYSATTPIADKVLKAMMPYFSVDFGNPSSIHQFGQKAEAALEESRNILASHLGCSNSEIVFTSGGTESDNLAIRGVAFAQRNEHSKNHLLISPVEHHAVSHTAQQLADLFGFELEYIKVDQYGMVSPQNLQNQLRPNTALVSIIYANNEIGTINPIPELAAVCQKSSVPFHTDAVQATAYLPLDVHQLNIDLLSIGAHKFYGPKGVGALYIKKDTPIIPVQTGGGHERGLRSGTPNIPYIVGLAEAIKFVESNQREWIENIRGYRDELVRFVLDKIPDAHLTGHPTKRLPNHASFVFGGVDSQKLLMHLDLAGFACSSGSACKTGNPQPSDVLLAMGYPPELALSSLRVTLGKDTTQEQIEQFMTSLENIIQKIRSQKS